MQVAAPNASRMTLVLFDASGKELQQFPFSAEQNRYALWMLQEAKASRVHSGASSNHLPLPRSGDVWHGLVKGLPKKGILYAYKVEGEGGWEQGHRWDASKLCLDPYAPLIEGRRRFGKRDEVEQYRPKVRPV